MEKLARSSTPLPLLRVGVTGHRTGPKLPLDREKPIRETIDRLFKSLSACVRRLAKTNENISDQSKSLLVVISALAEGADRIVAASGLENHCTLEAIIPFNRHEYLKDFQDRNSRDEFQQLLRQASSAFELDGKREQASRAYEAAGIVMLANSDILIAIWDQNEADGVGGTGLIVDRAINAGIPVVLINPAQASNAELIWASDSDLPPANIRQEDLQRSDAFIELDSIVNSLLSVPGDDVAQSSLAKFVSETNRRWNPCFWYPLLAFLFGPRKLQWSEFALADFLKHSRKRWADYFNLIDLDDKLYSAIEDLLLPEFAKADRLSVFYAQVYRSAYVFNFVASAVAIDVGIVGLILQSHSSYEPVIKALNLLELGAVLALFLTWIVGHTRQWHRRWLEYRRLAECLRHMRVLALMGLAGPISRPGKLNSEFDWVDWYATRIRRLLPVPNKAVNRSYLQSVHAAVCKAEIAEQIIYHRSNTDEMEALHLNLHRISSCLFGITGLILISVLAFPHVKTFPVVEIILVSLSALLPAIGAMLTAIRAQGDFEYVARRSEQTAQRLTRIERALSSEPRNFARLADLIEKASDTMMDDLVEWQLMFRSRPLSLPA
jgi:hypothetical protein